MYQIYLSNDTSGDTRERSTAEVMSLTACGHAGTLTADKEQYVFLPVMQ